MHHVRTRLPVGAQLALVHPEHHQFGRRIDEVRHPRRHEIEHGLRRPCTIDPELTVQTPDRSDGALVDVSHQPLGRIELRIRRLVRPCEEPGRELVVRVGGCGPVDGIVGAHWFTAARSAICNRSHGLP